MSKFHPNSGNLTRTSSSGSIPTPNQSQICDGGLSDDDDSDGARGVGSQGSSGKMKMINLFVDFVKESLRWFKVKFNGYLNVR